MNIYGFYGMMYGMQGIGVLVNVYFNPGILLSKCESRIGEYHIASKTVARYHINRAKELGLLEIQEEYRRNRLYLTPEGTEFVEDFLRFYRKWVSAEGGPYTDEELGLH